MLSGLLDKVKKLFYCKQCYVEHNCKTQKMIRDRISSINNDLLTLKLDIEKELEIHILESAVTKAKENNMLN